MPSIDEIVENFAFLDDWGDRYRYLIELGRMLEPLPADAHDETNRVRGCASQVWLETIRDGTRLRFRGDSDAFIVKGLIYLVLALFSARTATEILATDPTTLFGKLGLAEHLTPQRSNGLRAMVDRIKADAARAVDADALARELPPP